MVEKKSKNGKDILQLFPLPLICDRKHFFLISMSLMQEHFCNLARCELIFYNGYFYLQNKLIFVLYFKNPFIRTKR